MSGSPSQPLPNDVLDAIYAHAEEGYPEEVCGLIFADRQADGYPAPEAVRCENRQNALHAEDPQTFTRNARTAYNFAPRDFMRLDKSLRTPRPARIIYHSHCDVGAYFSAEDVVAAAPDGELLYPCDYLVVDCKDCKVRGSKLFRFQGGKFVEIGRMPAELAPALADKLARLREIVRAEASALVAFSGGADSALVLKIAADELGARAEALTAVSPTMARRERAAAEALAESLSVRLHVVESHELERPGFAQNPVDRCYHCKAELLDLMTPLAAERGLSALLLGTNLDDLGDHRPGLRAARERSAGQPLVEAGLSKAEVRAISRALALPTWDKPQLACLSSRFPYGTEITPERLSRLDRFEEGLSDLGFRQLRVRFHDTVARLELEQEALPRALVHREAIIALGKACGFTYVTIDLEGFRSGAMNEPLTQLRRSPARS